MCEIYHVIIKEFMCMCVSVCVHVCAWEKERETRGGGEASVLHNGGKIDSRESVVTHLSGKGNEHVCYCKHQPRSHVPVCERLV